MEDAESVLEARVIDGAQTGTASPVELAPITRGPYVFAQNVGN